jgi:Delta24(24(1))-sterol reductase
MASAKKVTSTKPSSSSRRSRSATPKKASSSSNAESKSNSPSVASPRQVIVAKASTGASKQKVDWEFGGPYGTLSIMIGSHILLYYVWYILLHNNCQMWLPRSWDEIKAAISLLSVSCAPTYTAALYYLTFIGTEGLFAMFMPGLDLLGRPDETGRRLMYKCNAYMSWIVTILGLIYLEYTGRWRIASFIENGGSIMTVAIIFADLQSVFWYLYAFSTNQTHRMSNNTIYDFFMGAILHPRIGSLDVKMFAEIRVSWFLLFLLTLSSACKAWELSGKPLLTFMLPSLFSSYSIQIPAFTPSFWLLILAHFLYANATSKGEHYVPPTWDITYEKYGWMLCFWNFAGVPFLYCKGSVLLYKIMKQPELPLSGNTFIILLTGLLLFAYYIWDTSQSQKNHFRLQFSGTVVERNTFPKLPWGTLENPKYIKTALGTPLLVDGWWKYARKIHYTADIIMAAIWGLSTGFGYFLPYIYVIFFTSMIIHRYTRDMHKCAKNYGKDWDRYCQLVPYGFIPYVI